MRLAITIFISIISLSYSSISLAQNTKVDIAIEKGLNNFCSIEKHSSSTLFALSYINDNFLNKQRSINNIIKEYLKNVSSKNKSRSFFRLLTPGNYLDTTNIAFWPQVDKITTAALYCDIIPLPKNYLETISNYSDTDDIYLITHCSMAIQFLIENNCLELESSVYTLLHDKLSDKIINYLETKKTVTDPYVESVMMLYYSGYYEKVKEIYIQNILDAQLPDGSWANGKNEDQLIGNDHTTILAIWALCAYRNKGKTSSTWIKK